MIPQSGVSAAAGRIAIDIRRFSWISRLAADYVFDYGRVSPFYAGDPADPAAWRAVIERTQQYPRRRGEVADLLQNQQRRRGAPPEAIASADRLRDPRAVAIVTGQQAGLFGGPLFTLLKALTAIRLAERVSIEHHVPAVPIFWVEGEDHDWDEVKACGVLDAEDAFKTIRIGDPPGAHAGPVARVCLDDSAQHALAELEATLRSTDFTRELVDTLRAAYRVGAGMADAFAQCLESVLGPRGLVVYDASDSAAKPILADLFVREVEHAGETSRLAREAGERMQASGYHAQATPHEGSLALFELNGAREPIHVDGDTFAIGDRRESKAELIARVRRSPEQFSPNVLLRPLVQDTLFPTVCYIAGPNELAYLGQLGDVYRAFGIPMPLMQQRATATVLDSNAMRFLTRHDLPFESLRAQDEAALNQLLEAQLPPTVEASLDDAMRVVHERMTTLASEVQQIDTTLEGATRSVLGRMQDDLKKLHAKIIHAAKRKDETLRRQFQHARAQAFPGGHPQEREIAFIYFLNKYGPALIDRLSDELPLEMGQHWVITV